MELKLNPTKPDITLMLTLAAWQAPVELIQDLYLTLTPKEIRTIIRRHARNLCPKRRLLSHNQIKDDNNMQRATGHINAIVQMYERLARQPIERYNSINTSDRALIIKTIDHYLAHFQDPPLDIDTIYLILKKHRQQETYRLHCPNCDNHYWSILENANCPGCQPWSRRNCRICKAPIFNAGAGRPREYCGSPECRRALKRQTYWYKKTG